MSWDMWHVHGHGIDCSALSNNILKEFCDNHRGVFQGKVNEHMLDAVSIGEIVAFVMKEETGIEFFSPGITDNDEDVVMFGPCYPWSLTEAERKLGSVEELYEIMRPYAEELGIPDKMGEFDLVYSG